MAQEGPEPATPSDREIDAAMTALKEIADVTAIGALVPEAEVADGVLTVRFACTLPGYPGWRWTVSVSRLDGQEDPTVLEAELLPGEAALLAPDWVPWSERLAEYRAQQEAARAAETDAAEAESDDADADEDGDADSDDSDEEGETDNDDLGVEDDDELATLEAQIDDADQTEDDADAGGAQAQHPGGGVEQPADDQ